MVNRRTGRTFSHLACGIPPIHRGARIPHHLHPGPPHQGSPGRATEVPAVPPVAVASRASCPASGVTNAAGTPKLDLAPSGAVETDVICRCRRGGNVTGVPQSRPAVRTARGAGSVPGRAGVRHPRGYTNLPESPASPPDRDGGRSGVPVPAASWPPSSSGGGSFHIWYVVLGSITSAQCPYKDAMPAQEFVSFTWGLAVGAQISGRWLTAFRPGGVGPGAAVPGGRGARCGDRPPPAGEPVHGAAPSRPGRRAGPVAASAGCGGAGSGHAAAAAAGIRVGTGSGTWAGGHAGARAGHGRRARRWRTRGRRVR
jgi:hypothetical protein